MGQKGRGVEGTGWLSTLPEVPGPIVWSSFSVCSELCYSLCENCTDGGWTGGWGGTPPPNPLVHPVYACIKCKVMHPPLVTDIV